MAITHRFIARVVFGIVLGGLTTLFVPRLIAQGRGRGIRNPPPAPVTLPQIPSRPLPQIPTPPAKVTGRIHRTPQDPQVMKLLVLTGDGTEPSYAAIQTFLKLIGIPYDSVVLANTNGALPALSDPSQNEAFYQGIVLATGNLVVCSANGCASALPPSGWQQLDNFAAAFAIRTVSYYTWPEARYGLSWNGCAVSTTAANPGTVTFAAGAPGIFSNLYMTSSPQVQVTGAYAYFANTVAAAGETTTPVLTLSALAVCNGTTRAATATAAAYHRAADGRESLAVTIDNNPYLLHSLAFNYGLFNWVTRGVFLGARRIYLTPQADDLFLANDLYDPAISACVPPTFILDPTSTATDVCPQLRDTQTDISALLRWQSGLASNPKTAGVRLTWAFNGVGATADGGAPDPDTLASSISDNSSSFYFVNHTYDHENLDCYNPVPNSGVCTPATYSQSLAEINNNLQAARDIGITVDRGSMVTPDLSGLSNPAFLQAAVDKGIQYLVIDALKAGVSANAGVVNPYQRSILMIPRHATNIFYNVDNDGESVYGAPVGSEPDEYNYFYGPDGIARLPDGSPYFTTDQSYDQVLGNESANVLNYMMRYEAYPIMFHQSNLRAYSGSSSLTQDLLNRALGRFQALFTLPVTSLSEKGTGDLLRARMGYDNSGVQGMWTPGVSVKLTTINAAVIPVTGICAQGCQTYGNQSISKVNLPAGGSATMNY